MFKYSPYGIKNQELFSRIYSGFIDYCKEHFNTGTFSTYCDGEPVFMCCGLELSYSKF